MAIDGGLRKIFQAKLPQADWTSVETWSTGRGVPDVNYCFPGGIEGWIEFKQTSEWKVDMRPEQVAWIERRVRHGGRIFIAVRRKTEAGPRRGPPRDELWIARGEHVRALATGELGKGYPGSYIGFNGPGRWLWSQIEAILKG